MEHRNNMMTPAYSHMAQGGGVFLIADFYIIANSARADLNRTSPGCIENGLKRKHPPSIHIVSFICGRRDFLLAFFFKKRTHTALT